jgi:hypothetical protein
MTSSTPPVAAKRNRWALPAVIASVISLGNLLVTALAAFGIPYSLVHERHQFLLCQIGHACVNAVFTAFALAGLILGTTVVVQCRASKVAEKGLRSGYVAVILALAVFFLGHVIWVLGALVNFVRTQ